MPLRFKGNLGHNVSAAAEPGRSQPTERLNVNSTERNELVAYLATEFERLADAGRPRHLNRREHAELVQWLKLEFRRLAKRDGDKHSCCTVDTRRFVVRVQPTPAPHLNHGMSVPPCLMRPDTEAGLARLGLPRTSYERTLDAWSHAGRILGIGAPRAK